MIRTLLADDEEWIRLGLRAQLDWASLGVEIVAEASNGVEALEKIARVGVDLILMDINMPVMGGIRLMQELHDRYPDLAIIVISGYSDFAYAREAIRHNAVDYVLKPVEEELLTKAIERAVERIREGREQAVRSLEAEGERKEGRQLRAERFLRELLEDENAEGSAAGIAAAWEACGLPAPATPLVAAYLSAAQPEAAEAMAAWFAKREETCGVIAVLPYASGRSWTVVMERDESSADGKLRSAPLPAPLPEPLPEGVYAGIGCACAGPAELRASYLQALEAHAFAGAPGMPATVGCAEAADRQRPFAPGEQRLRAFLAQLENGHAADCALYLDRLFAEMVDSRNSLRSIRSAAAEHILRIEGTLLKHSGLHLADLPEASGILGFVGQPTTSIREILAAMGRLTDAAIAMIAGAAAGKETNAIGKIKTYVDEHYGEEIGLVELAQQFHLNATYLSRVFKKEMGVNLNDYINRLRLERAAVLLLDTSLSMESIAESVGYGSAKYFFKRFKDHFGMTPSTYKQEHGHR